MLTDLYMNKKQQVYEFIKQKKFVKTHEVIEFGLSIFTNRGDRYARELAQEGKIKRMDESKRKFYFPDCKEEVWEICDWHNNFKI